MSDLFPFFKDYKQYIGISLFWCITCDGHKANSKKVLVVGNTDEAAETAMQFLNFTKDVTFVTNCHPDEVLISSVWLKRFEKRKFLFIKKS